MVEETLLHRGLKAVLSQYKIASKDRNTRDHLAWTIGVGSHARSGYPTHDTSRMGTARE